VKIDRDAFLVIVGSLAVACLPTPPASPPAAPSAPASQASTAVAAQQTPHPELASPTPRPSTPSCDALPAPTCEDAPREACEAQRARLLPAVSLVVTSCLAARPEACLALELPSCVEQAIAGVSPLPDATTACRALATSCGKATALGDATCVRLLSAVQADHRLRAVACLVESGCARRCLADPG
jgi:hypothetical protein